MSKIKNYEVAICKSDPIISLKIPSNILRDLVLRSEENGSSIESEFIIRLARSLERDNETAQEDNEYMLRAYKMNQN